MEHQNIKDNFNSSIRKIDHIFVFGFLWWIISIHLESITVFWSLLFNSIIIGYNYFQYNKRQFNCRNFIDWQTARTDWSIRKLKMIWSFARFLDSLINAHTQPSRHTTSFQRRYDVVQHRRNERIEQRNSLNLRKKN